MELSTIEVDAWRRRLSAAFQDFARFEFPARHAAGVGDLPRLRDRPAVLAALDRAGAPGVPAALPARRGAPAGLALGGPVDLSTGHWQTLAPGRAQMLDSRW